MTADTEVAEIAAGLTEAERIVLRAASHPFVSTPRGSCVADARRLLAAGLLDVTTITVITGITEPRPAFVASPIGQRVAAYLKEQSR